MALTRTELIDFLLEVERIHNADLANLCKICRSPYPCAARRFAEEVFRYFEAEEATPEADAPQPPPQPVARLKDAVSVPMHPTLEAMMLLLPPPGERFKSPNDLMNWISATTSIVRLTYGPSPILDD